MATGVNVLRYSALGLGVIYGIYHQLSISSATKVASAKREYQHKSDLITKAKEEYTKRTTPASALQSSSSSNVITNPEDPNFDLEKWIKSVEKGGA